MSYKANTKLVSMRFPLDVLEKMDTLADMFGMSRTQFVCTLVNARFDEVNNNEETLALIAEFKNLSEKLKQYNMGVTS